MTEITALAALFTGVLALLSPCSALLLPSFFAYAFSSKRALVARTAVFTLGLMAMLVPLGSGLRALTGLFNENRAVMISAAGWIIIGFGVLLLLGKGFALPGNGPPPAGLRRVEHHLPRHGLGELARHVRARRRVRAGRLLLGPGARRDPHRGGHLCHPGHGAILMAFYALGMAIPLFVLALLWERFDIGRKGWVRGRTLELGPLRVHTTNLVAGLLFIAVGWLFIRYDGTAGLLSAIPGLDLTDLEFDAQVAIIRFFADTPLWVAPLLVMLVALGVAWRRWHAGRAAAGRADGSRDDVEPADLTA